MSGNGLPEHLSSVVEEVNIKHNWLYSVIPGDADYEFYDQKGQPQKVMKSNIYLTGYCKNCNTAFSAPVPYDPYRTILTDMAIPKDGCSGSNI